MAEHVIGHRQYSIPPMIYVKTLILNLTIAGKLLVHEWKLGERSHILRCFSAKLDC